jgi:purine-binding chemotaxis protein CheW
LGEDDVSMTEPSPPSDQPPVDLATSEAEDGWRAALVGSTSVGVGEGEPYLLIRVGPVWLALEVRCVDEVDAMVQPTALPLVPPHIPGIVSLHGQVLPLLDLGLFLEVDEIVSDDTASGAHDSSFERVVVVLEKAFRVGLLCHQVRGIMRVPREELEKPQVIVSGRVRQYASAEIQLRDAVVAVLDIGALLEAAKVAS